jgi:adenylate cyclase
MAADLTPIFVWLAGQSLCDAPVEDLVGGLGERLNENGFDIARAHISGAALHPMVSAFMINWRPGGPAVRSERNHDDPEGKAWRESPLLHMLDANLPVMRQRLDRANAPFAFPVFEELAGEGMTEWIAFREGFDWNAASVPGGQFGIIASLTTRRPGGFDDAEMPGLLALVQPIAAAVKTHFVGTVARDVLSAYIGTDAAQRVLSGAITRGGVTQMPAVVMMADLKGFSRFSNTRPIREVVARLNDCFDRIATAVGDAGGHVLKFIGDGVLAIFLLEGRGEAEAAAAALAAAEAIQAGLPPGVGIDIGLNIGEVHYGNIGAAGRLDFTAIGPAVNEAARLEALCGVLDQRVLLSGALAAVAPLEWRSRLTPLGAHPLKGFDTPREVFALA